MWFQVSSPGSVCLDSLQASFLLAGVEILIMFDTVSMIGHQASSAFDKD